jgi:hypothetical protein
MAARVDRAGVAGKSAASGGKRLRNAKFIFVAKPDRAMVSDAVEIERDAAHGP